MPEENTVFISYRRANSAHAFLVTEKLRDHNYDVFIDVDSLGSGAFSPVIMNQIAARPHFLVILTPSTLERCIQPNDWVRKEIEQAMDLKRNIVPIMFDGFDYKTSTQYLTGKLSILLDYNGVIVDYNYFDAVVEKLVRFLNVPLSLVLHPTPSNDRAIVQQSIDNTSKIPTPTKEQLEAELYFERGFLKLENLDQDGAIADFTKATELNPKFDEAFYHRGRAYGNKRNKEQAITDWQEAVRLEPDDLRVNITRSCIYRERGDYKRSLIEADAGVSLNPTDPDAYFQRGNVKRHLKDWDGAIGDYSQAIELTPKTATLYMFNRAMTNRDKGNYAEAMQEWMELVRLNPNSGRPYNGRAVTYYLMGDLDNALVDCLKANELESNRATHASLGAIYFARGEYQTAFQHYTKSCEIDPDYEFAIAGLAICHHAMENYRLAVELWERLVAKDTQYQNDPEWLKQNLNWVNPLIDEARKLITRLNN